MATIKHRTARNQQRKDPATKTVNITISIYPRDDEMIQELRDYFGTSQSDAVRTAVRALYVKLLGKNA